MSSANGRGSGPNRDSPGSSSRQPSGAKPKSGSNNSSNNNNSTSQGGANRTTGSRGRNLISSSSIAPGDSARTAPAQSFNSRGDRADGDADSTGKTLQQRHLVFPALSSIQPPAMAAFNFNQSSHHHHSHHQFPLVVSSTSSGSPTTSTSDTIAAVEDGFRFLEPAHSRNLLAGLNSMRLNRMFCDVVLCVDGKEFPAHRIVLSAFSAYFRAMFGSEMAEKSQDNVSLNGLEPCMVDLILQYAYTSEILVTKSNVQSLLSASNLLQVIPVRDACCDFMLRHMDEANVLGVHCFAETHACGDLACLSKDFILESFVDIVAGEEFLELGEAKLVEILDDDNLKVDNEETVFAAAIRWLEHDRAARSANFDRVLSHVRLPLVSPYFLHDCVEKRAIVSENAACRLLLDEAVRFHLLPDRRHEMRGPRTRPRKAWGLVEVIVLVGGEDDKVVLRSVESFDPATHAWKTLLCLPFAVSKHGLVASGTNSMFLAGGEFPDGAASRSLWKFDPSLNAWQELAQMNVPRSELGLALLDGSIYAVGGWEGSQRLDSVERFNQSTNTWSFTAGLKMAITSPAVVALDGFLYVTGGAVLEDGDGIDLVQRYDPRTNEWKELRPMLIPRSGSAACALDGQLYVIGGWHASTENTDKVERYDPNKDQWTAVAGMNERRYRPGVAVVDGRIYVCGGEEGWDRYHDTIERFDPKTDAWEVVSEMPTSRSWLSCVALQIKKDHSAVCGEVVKERHQLGLGDRVSNVGGLLLGPPPI